MMLTNRRAMIGLTALMIAGCNRTPPARVPTPTTETSSGPVEVTLYVANMNRELKIL